MRLLTEKTESRYRPLLGGLTLRYLPVVPEKPEDYPQGLMKDLETGRISGPDFWRLLVTCAMAEEKLPEEYSEKHLEAQAPLGDER